MKRFFYFRLVLLFVTVSHVHSQDWKCANVDTVASVIEQSTVQNVPLVIVYIDFIDGRKQPGNRLPITDADLDSVANLNGVGGMGWEQVAGVYKKKIRKYVYEDYWNMYFSIGTYANDSIDSIHPHPDWGSHGIKVYGSLTDYYKEATYNNINFYPATTHSGGTDMYHTGIVNRIDTANGKNYIRWLMVPENKCDSCNGYTVLPSDLIAWKNQGLIDFDTTGFFSQGGRIVAVNAGSNKGGLTTGTIFCSVREKRYSNLDNLSTLDGILVSAHELGHSFGASHTLTGCYDVMNYSFRNSWIRQLYCPQHFNPWFKIQKGWIPLSNIRIIRSNSSISLPSITDSAVVAIVNVFGEAGKYNSFNHSEYFIVEYRKRSGFNRFAGGEFVSGGFNGGGIIWGYSSFSKYVFPDASNITNLIAKLPPTPEDESGRIGSPDDFFINSNILDSCDMCIPNSSSISKMKTGIKLNNFVIQNDRLIFDANYLLGAPPSYDYVYTFGHMPSTLSGNIFMDMSLTIGTRILPGSVLEFAPNTFISLIDKRLIAKGGVGASEKITFQGVGYGNYKFKWGDSSRSEDYNLNGRIGIFCGRTTSTDTFQLENCIIKSTDIGVFENFGNSYSQTSFQPIIRNNNFNANLTDIVIKGKNDISQNSYLPDISGLDSNQFKNMHIRGLCKISYSQEFTIPSGDTLLLRNNYVQDVTPLPTKLVIENNHSLKVDGIFISTDTVSINGGNVVLNGGGTIRAGSLLTIGGGTSITSADMNVQANATYKIDTGSTVKFLSGSTLTMNGKLLVRGTSANRVTFTSSNATPAPGDWAGIVCSGGGSDTLKYCDIKYAATGISFVNTSANSYMEQDSVLYCSDKGVNVSNTGTSNVSLKLYKSKIMNNPYYGMRVNNAKVAVNYSRIKGNGSGTILDGIYILNGGKAYFDSSRIDSNLRYGVYVKGTNSRASLSKDEVARGYNTFTQSGFSEIKVDSSATAFLGNTVSVYDGCVCPQGVAPPDNKVYSTMTGGGCNSPCYQAYHNESRGGWNNVYNSYTTNYRLVYNATSTTIPAHYTYWGSGSNMFYGSVDTAHQLGSAISTPAKSIIDAPTVSGNGLDRSSMINWLRSLKTDIESGSANAIDALNQLALHTGPGGEYSDALDISWESFLSIIEGKTELSRKIKETALALRLQSKMDQGNFSSAIGLANQILNRSNLNDNFWLYCQTRKIFAYAGLGATTSARNILSSMYSRGVQIDSDAVAAMKEYLDLLPSSDNNSVVIADRFNEEQESKPLSKPNVFSLEQNFPNPFNPATIIRYQIPQDGNVSLKVYNILGQEIAILVNEVQQAGEHTIEFNGGNLASGLYFYKLVSGNYTDIKKMILTR